MFPFKLRPVDVSDAPLIFELRSDAQRSRYLHSITGGVAEQENWILEDAQRIETRYFAVQRGTETHGFVGLSMIDGVSASAEWGRWILREDSPAAVPSAKLIYEYGFEELELKRLYCRTIVENKSVVRFHDACGATRIDTISDYFEIDGVNFAAIEHQVTIDQWPNLKANLQRLTRLLER